MEVQEMFIIVCIINVELISGLIEESTRVELRR